MYADVKGFRRENFTRCQRERLKHGSSYELGIFMLTALSSTLPDLKMQFTQRSVSVLGDHMLAALLSCDSTPDFVLEAEVNQDEVETCRPTSAPFLEADGTPAPQPDPTGTICSASHVAAPMELLVGGQTFKQPTFPVGGED